MKTLKRIGKFVLWLVLLPVFGPAMLLLHLAGEWWQNLLDD